MAEPRKTRLSIQPIGHGAVDGVLRVAGIGWNALHCGCADNLQPGCLNTDLTQLIDPQGNITHEGSVYLLDDSLLYLPHDATQAFPAATGSQRWVYSEHLVEHITLQETVNWLCEMYRVLEPGGVIRISTPDLEGYINGYLDKDEVLFSAARQYHLHFQKQVPMRRSFWVNQIFYFWGHRWIYDFEELSFALTVAGFPQEQIVRREFRVGAIPEMANLDGAIRRYESLYVEATK